MTDQTMDALILQDAAGAWYEIPAAVIQAHRVPGERTAELEQAAAQAAEQDAAGYVYPITSSITYVPALYGRHGDGSLYLIAAGTATRQIPQPLR